MNWVKTSERKPTEYNNYLCRLLLEGERVKYMVCFWGPEGKNKDGFYGGAFEHGDYYLDIGYSKNEIKYTHWLKIEEPEESP